MPIWIAPQRRIKEGTYVFRFEQDLEFEQVGRGQWAVLVLKAINEYGEIDFKARFPVWSQQYPDLMKALGVEHGSDLDATGMTFEAEIKYQPDPKRPNRSWPHLVNIRTAGTSLEDGEIPF